MLSALLTVSFVTSSWALATPPPFTPPGGLGTNSTPPVYHPMSDFDFQSLTLALNQEWIELDLFHFGLSKFSPEEFERFGIDAADQFLIEFMADQEVGHATLLSNILGPGAAKPCNYTYPFETVPDFIDFCQKLTRWGESGTLGFLEHLDSRPSAQLLLQSITTESRQQMIFRQFEGLFPMPVWHEVTITQSMAWTLLAPFIMSCPAENPHLEWQNFPALTVINNPNATNSVLNRTAAISTNETALSAPGRVISLEWETPGKIVGPNGSYVTNTTAGAPKFAAWVSQLNTTYTVLSNITNNSATTVQPGGELWPQLNQSTPLINGTMFIVVTDDDPFLTPFNFSMINKHIVAGPVVYQSG